MKYLIIRAASREVCKVCTLEAHAYIVRIKPTKKCIER